MRSLRTTAQAMLGLVLTIIVSQYIALLFVFIPQLFHAHFIPLTAQIMSYEIQAQLVQSDDNSINFERIEALHHPWFISGIGNPIIINEHHEIIYPDERRGTILANVDTAFAVIPLQGTSIPNWYFVIEQLHVINFFQYFNVVWMLAVSTGSVLIALSIVVLFLWRNEYRFIRPLAILVNKSQASQDLNTLLMKQLPAYTVAEIIHLAEVIDQRNQRIVDQITSRRIMNAEIAHELRNPLNTISGYIEGMRDGVITVTHTRLDIVHSEVRALQRIIEDFRILSLIDIQEYTSKPQLIRPTELGEQVLQLAASQLPNQTFTHSFHMAMWVEDYHAVIRVDVERMVQVFKNIIDNAVLYSPPHSTITLIGDARRDVVIITCHNDGPGIPEHDLPHIFDRFYRGTNAQQAGSGLGLAIAHEIIRIHMGTIQATSSPTHGTTITITLPIHHENNTQTD